MSRGTMNKIEELTAGIFSVNDVYVIGVIARRLSKTESWVTEHLLSKGLRHTVVDDKTFVTGADLARWLQGSVPREDRSDNEPGGYHPL